MNYLSLALDYYLQAVEVGTDKQEAAKLAINKLNRFKDFVLDEEEYNRYSDLIKRLAKI